LNIIKNFKKVNNSHNFKKSQHTHKSKKHEKHMII